MAEGAELIQKFYDETLSNGNMDAIDDLVTDDVVDHEEGLPGQPEGKEGVRFFVSMMREAFSDLKATVGPAVESGDMASAEVTITGRHTGEFMGVPATDKSFEIKSIDIVRFEDGKCAEHWGVTDNMALMMQIGAIPEPAQT
ncbi:MAG TPA: ester cyclase [Solirubrobacterales bacterium]|nr:ester cyclase [Solirubrobacterales bacterium]